MIPNELWPLIWAPALLGGLLAFLAASAGAWKPGTRKRLRAAGMAMLLGFGSVAVFLIGADAAVARDWVGVSQCAGAFGLAAWLGSEIQPWRIGRRLKLAGMLVFAFAGLWRVWLTYERESALYLTLATLGVAVVATLAVSLLARRTRSQTADVGQR